MSDEGARPVVREGDLDDIEALARRIPEWDDPYELFSRGRRVVPALDHILVVEVSGQPIAFRAGYRCAPGAFRIWLAAVVPDYRRRGIARLMYETQKAWLRRQGFREIRTYTRRGNEAMMHILRCGGYEETTETEPGRRKDGDWVDFVKRL